MRAGRCAVTWHRLRPAPPRALPGQRFGRPLWILYATPGFASTLSKSHHRCSAGVVAVLTCGSLPRAGTDGYPRTPMNETATETAVSILPRLAIWTASAADLQ